MQSAGPLRGLRARAAVQAASASEDHQAAALLAAEALRLDSRLPESLLFEWLQTVGGLLLCHRWGEARAWLEALTIQTPAVTAASNPIPRRIAWIARLALELVQPSSIDLEWELNELYLLRWLPPSRTEHQVWDAWLEAFLHSVAGELEQDDQRDLGRCRIVLEALLPALSGVRTPQRSDGGLVHRFQLLVQGCQFRAPRAAAQLSLSLQRQSYDWLALMPLLEQSCELDDRALLKLRPELELALDRFSDALLRWPPLLVLQPSESLLHASVRLREQALMCCSNAGGEWRRAPRSSRAIPGRGAAGCCLPVTIWPSVSSIGLSRSGSS